MQYFRKNRQNSEKIEKYSEKCFQEFGKILVGLKKKGGSYSNLGRKNPRKNTENPEQSWRFREGLKV